MLPVHLLNGSTHYVLVEGRTRAGRDDERVAPREARVLLDAALRRREPGLVERLTVLLKLRGYDHEDVCARALAQISTGRDLYLYRTRQFEVGAPADFELPVDAPEPEPVDDEIETHWIEVQLMSEDDPPVPIAGAKYEIELPNGQLRTGVLNDSGMVRLDGIPPGECKVRFPEYDEPDPAGEVEPEELGPAPEPNTCEIVRFEAKCAHADKRGYELALPARKVEGEAEEDIQVLEVLGAAEGEGDEIEVRTTLLGTRCSEHAAAGIEVVRPSPDEALTFAEDFAHFDAYYGDIALSERLFPWNMEPREYQVRPLTCDSHQRHVALIRVFPNYEVSFKVALGLDAASRSTAALAKARSAGSVERRGRPAHSDWKFEIEGAVSYGNDSFKLAASYESKLENLATVNRWVKQAIDEFCEIFRKFFGLDIELNLPNLALEYKGKFVELDRSCKVSPEWSLTFAADPLIGVTLKVDVLDLMIRALQSVPALTGVMTFLRKVRAWAEDHGQVIALTCSMSGRIVLEAQGSKARDKRLAEVGAKGRGQVVVGFEAKAETSGGLWIVSYEAGASIAGATGLSLDPGFLSDSEGLALSCDLVLLPLEFDYGIYGSGKFRWSKKRTAKTGGSHTFWQEQKLLEGKKYVVRYDGAKAGQ